VLKILEIINK
ncbi:uncharacterized protein CELE_T28F3.11, partial [Caenorhabditis elegans]